MAKDIESEGGKVLYVKVKQVAPKVASRLIGVELVSEVRPVGKRRSERCGHETDI